MKRSIVFWIDAATLRVLGREEYTAADETHEPAQRLPVASRSFECCACAANFMALPGSAECPRCRSVYARDLTATQ